MDAYEATRIVFQRIQTLDPQNAAKIMGLLLIQDHGEKEMIRLAFGPESLLYSVILKAKKDLTLPPPNMPSIPPPPPLSPFSNPSLSRQNSCPSSAPTRLNLPSPLSITTPCSWTNSSTNLSDDFTTSPSTMNSAAAPFYGSGEIDLIDELHLQDHLSFLNDGKSSDFLYQDLGLSPNGSAPCFHPWGGLPGGHRRSYSVSDIYMGGSEDVTGGGLGWKPCLFYARGYCKNGTSCRFLHGGEDGGAGAALPAVGSPSKFEMMEQQSEELLVRSKPAQQLLASSPNFSYSPKCINLLDSPRALIMGDGMHSFGRFGTNGVNPGSRQIYLTFPADSTFKEEDVSNYFSNFGPVQDVRIPYQQKRMFGFVTFEYPETVKLILAKGNPHFVCDARVLVKPYKEKGKIPDKHRKQQQQIERGEFVGLSNPSPIGLEPSRDPYDIQLGGKMFYGAQDMLWRRKLEEAADLQQTVELQNRRFMGLQLFDVKRKTHQCAVSSSPVVSSPTYSPTSFFNFNVMSSNQSSPEAREEIASIGTVEATINAIEKDTDEIKISKESPPIESDSSDHNLPDSPFASPKAAGDYATTFSTTAAAAAPALDLDKDSTVSDPSTSLLTGATLFPATSLDTRPFKACYFHVPRFASGRETVGMQL